MEEDHNQEVPHTPEDRSTPTTGAETSKLPTTGAPDESIYAVPMDLPGETKKKKKTKWKIFVPVVIGIILLAAGVYLFISGKNNKQPGQQSTAEAPSTPAPAADEVPDVTGTETYKSDVLGVTLTHPTSWKATRAT